MGHKEQAEQLLASASTAVQTQAETSKRKTKADYQYASILLTLALGHALLELTERVERLQQAVDHQTKHRG